MFSIHFSFSFAFVCMVISQNIHREVANCGFTDSSMFEYGSSFYCVKFFRYNVSNNECRNINGETFIEDASENTFLLAMKKAFTAQFQRVHVRHEKSTDFVLIINVTFDEQTTGCMLMDYKLLTISKVETVDCTNHTIVFYACYFKKVVKSRNRRCSLIFDTPRKPCERIKNVHCAQEIKFKKEIIATGSLNCTVPEEVKNPQRSPCKKCLCPESKYYKDDGVCDCLRGKFVVPKIEYGRENCERTFIPPMPKFVQDDNCDVKCVIDGPTDLCVYDKWTNFNASLPCRNSKILRLRENLKVENKNCKSLQVSESINNASFDDCNTCQIYYADPTWSSCNDTCGFGVSVRKILRIRKGRDLQNRCRDLTNGSIEKRFCPGVPCPENCSYSEWTDWGTCNVECGKGGTRSRNRTLLTSATRGGNCDDNSTIGYENCFGKFRECQKDCNYTEWGNWSNCLHCRPKASDILVQKRSRNITFRPTPFGIKCNNSALNEVKNCMKQTECQIPGEMTDEDEGKIKSVVLVISIIVLLIIIIACVVMVFARRGEQQKVVSGKVDAQKKHDDKLNEEHSSKHMVQERQSCKSQIKVESNEKTKPKKVKQSSKFKSSSLNPKRKSLSESSKLKNLPFRSTKENPPSKSERRITQPVKKTTVEEKVN